MTPHGPLAPVSGAGAGVTPTGAGRPARPSGASLVHELQTGARMLSRFLSLSLLLGLAACESGTARSLQVTVPADVASRFSAQAPGVVVSDLTGQASPWVVLCGQALENPLFLSYDEGFGCLDATVGAQEPVRVWIEPVDAGAFACSTQQEFYRAQPAGPADGGAPFVASSPDPGRGCRPRA